MIALMMGAASTAATTQKTAIFILAAVRTSSVTYSEVLCEASTKIADGLLSIRAPFKRCKISFGTL
jgi:hypothetical protein